MGKFSRDKGKRGELAWRDVLLQHGIQARRGRQFSGSPDSPDVIAEGMESYHCEVKNVEALKAYPAMEQAISDAGTGKVPYIAHKRNGKGWLVFLRASDFLALVRLQLLVSQLTGVDLKSGIGPLLSAVEALLKERPASTASGQEIPPTSSTGAVPPATE